MRQQTQIRQQLCNKNGLAKLRKYQNEDFIIYFEIQSLEIEMEQEIKGHIVINTKNKIINKDLQVTFEGVCIYYSQNPSKQIMRSDQTLIDKQQSMNQELNTTQKNNTLISTRIQKFLQGSQILRYIGDGQKQIKQLQKGNSYYLPFNFYLPANSPASINFMNFPPLFLSIKYSLSIKNLLEQEIILIKTEKANFVEQFITNTLDFRARRFCFDCLGDYRIEMSATVTQEYIKMKLLNFRKAQKGTISLFDKINVKFIGEIEGVSRNTILQKDVKLQIIQYEILGSEFLFQKNNRKFKSEQNELFKLFYYFELSLFPKKYIQIDQIQQIKINIPL